MDDSVAQSAADAAPKTLVAAIAVFLATLAWIGGSSIGTGEAELFRALNTLPGMLFWPLWLLMQAGSQGAVVVTVLAAVLAGRRHLALLLAGSGAAAYVAASGVKELVARPRPALLVSDVIVRGSAQEGLGYVSGHAAIAAALAAGAGPFLPRTARWMIWGTAFVVAAARVYVGAHLPADVIGGAALGVAAAVGWRMFLSSWQRERDPGRREAGT